MRGVAPGFSPARAPIKRSTTPEARISGKEKTSEILLPLHEIRMTDHPSSSLAVNRRSETGATTVQNALEEIRERFKGFAGRSGVTAAKHFPARPARSAPFPPSVPPRLVEILKARGIENLYTHQATTMELASQGKNLVVVTPTASGKTLCYNLPILSALVENPEARALYLFPTKALSQDQLVELNRWTEKLGDEVRTFTYDGDTPQDARKAIRSRGNLVITNPDMLHAGILPHHTKWERLFENLRYVVIDELHYYRGVFGSHLANVLRRLKRIAAFYGSRPQFICASATIANPADLAARILEEDVVLVDDNGAPSGEKYFVFYNPPVVNPQLGIRRSYLNETRRVARTFLERGLETIIFANSRLATEILVTYLKEDFARGPAGRKWCEVIAAAICRWSVARSSATCARAACWAWWRPTPSNWASISARSTWPCSPAIPARLPPRGSAPAAPGAARVAPPLCWSPPARRSISSWCRTRSFSLATRPSTAYVNPDNLQILLNHLKCAAFELPLREDEKFGALDLRRLCEHLEELRFLHRSSDGWHWISESYPADAISLRSVSSDNFVIVDNTAEPRVIGEVDFTSALTTVHEKAIYIQDGEQYHVERLDYDDRKAYVHRVESEYFTDAISYTKIKVLETFESEALERNQKSEIRNQKPEQETSQAAGDFRDARTPDRELRIPTKNHGEVQVNTQVVGWKKIKFGTMENVGSGQLSLPEQEMHTTAFWLTLAHEMLESLPYTGNERLDGVNGLGNAMQAIATLLLMCDARDLGVAVGENEEQKAESRTQKAEDDGQRTADNGELPNPKSKIQNLKSSNPIFEPNVYLYDKYPGGVGFSEPLFRLSGNLIANTKRLIENCSCLAGCPSCVGPPGEVGERGKEVALAILQKLIVKA